MRQFVVIGMGRFGSAVATALYDLGNDVLALDNVESRLDRVSERVTHAVQADATDEAALQALGLSNFDVAIIATGNVEATTLISLLCKDMGVPLVISKATSELHAKALRKIGVDKVIFPEKDMGVRLAHSLVSTNVLDYIEISPDYSLVEITAPDKWANRSLLELNVRSEYGINILAIKSGDGSINVSPRSSNVIRVGDTLVVVGSNVDIHRLESK
ncbi:MAG: TrkA family potassium uptake protein [Eubacteriales bacterium]|nr:TrkA family potassium uptake protein [Eubacteriales bacterium]